MEQKYAIFLDLDGTALSSHNHINQKLIDVTGQLKNQGHQIFIATGRQFYGAIPFHQQLKLETPLITLNGGAIYDKNRTVLHKETLDHSFLNYLLASDDYREKITVGFFDTLHQTVATSNDKILNDFFYAQMPENLQPDIAFHHPTSANKAHFTDTISVFSILPRQHLPWAEDLFLKYEQETPHHNVKSRIVEKDISNNVAYCEFFPESAFKSAGIAWTIENLKLQGYKTMAFGDGSNDPDMLSFVDHGVAMKNGCKEVYDVADAVTSFTNVEDGVAEYLQSYFG